MEVKYAFPPNYAKIVAAFPHVEHNRHVLFCYGRFIWNPYGCTLAERDHAHEKVHSNRQGDNPEAWWERYLADPVFRFEEEVLAHVVEYAFVSGPDTARNERRFYLNHIAERLAGPLYGRLITKDLAKRLLKEQAAISLSAVQPELKPDE